MMKKNGFTLIELLVVMTIVGVLAAIAIPQYSEYRKRAFDLRAESDLRNAAIAEEAYFLDAERYLSCSQASCTKLPGIKRLSPDVVLAITAATNDFTGVASHPKGSGKSFRWDSSQGGLMP